MVYLSEQIDKGTLDKLKSHATVVSIFENIEEIDKIIVRRTKGMLEIIQRAKHLKVTEIQFRSRSWRKPRKKRSWLWCGASTASALRKPPRYWNGIKF